MPTKKTPPTTTTPPMTTVPPSSAAGFVRVRGAREHNLKDVDVDVPRDAFVVFTGVSGSGKSSLAFGTIYAEAQRRFLESVSPYARRLFEQMSVPDVRGIEGLPPAVALQQQRGTPTARSSVGSVTTLANLLRMLYSRAGSYPPNQALLHAEAFSPNTPQGACPTCQGLGHVVDVSERLMVPDDTKTIRERAIEAWPTAWGGQNLRDICVTLGIDVDTPWKELAKKDRDWLLFTEEQPRVPVYAGFTPKETKAALRRKEAPSYMGTFSSARRHVMQSFKTTDSAQMKKRAARFMEGTLCPTCGGRRLNVDALSVTFEGKDIAAIQELPLRALSAVLSSTAQGRGASTTLKAAHPERALAAERIAKDLVERIAVLEDLGLGHLQLDRPTPTLSPGELQRLRLATQVRSQLFGVVYVLDEPSAGLHPFDTAALLRALSGLRAAGNSVFVVEHELEIVRQADWIVDVGPGAGSGGGEILYSGPVAGLAAVTSSQTRRHLFRDATSTTWPKRRMPSGALKLRGVTRNNLRELDVEIPLGVLCAVTGISGSGKSSLASQALVELVGRALGAVDDDVDSNEDADAGEDAGIEQALLRATKQVTAGRIDGGLGDVKRLVRIDQKAIGRTPRSNLATYTGLFDHVRKQFAAAPLSKQRHYDAGRFSFNVAKGRCETCNGEGAVMVELLFLPSIYAPCPACHGARFNADTLEVELRGKTIADVLQMTVDEAAMFFADTPALDRSLQTLRDVGLGYLRLGQPATTVSGGEAQRIKLATELAQPRTRGSTLYILDEPTTGLHPSDVERLMKQLNALVDAGHSVVVVEHDMDVIAGCDVVIDTGPGAGDDGGRIVCSGTPEVVADHVDSRTAPYLRRHLRGTDRV